MSDQSYPNIGKIEEIHTTMDGKKTKFCWWCHQDVPCEVVVLARQLQQARTERDAYRYLRDELELIFTYGQK